MIIAEEKERIPNDAIEALARCLYPAIRSYFESEEGKVAFEEYKKAQGTKALWIPADEKQAS